MNVISGIAGWLKHSPTLRSIGVVGEYVGKLTVLFGIGWYLWEAPERAKQSYYQAWQVVNSAHFSSGDAGRHKALKDLVDGGNSLNELDLTNASVEQFDLHHSKMKNVIFSNSKIIHSNFDDAIMD